MPRVARRALAVSCLALAAGGCSANYGMHEPASREGDSVLHLWRGLLLTATVLGAIVLALLAFGIVRYRRRGRTDLPSQHAGHVPLEVLYTAIPFVVVAAIFVVGLRTQDHIDSHGPVDLDVGVTGFQWGWRFEYTGTPVVVQSTPGEDPVLVLPLGRTVRFTLASRDVIHSFFVPAFEWKRDAIPGYRNTIVLVPNRVGDDVGHCAEFCALDHARMNFVVRVVPPDEFDQWLRTQGAS